MTTSNVEKYTLVDMGGTVAIGDRRITTPKEAMDELNTLSQRVAELEKQLSDAHDQDNEMCEGMNAVLDKYNPDWDDVQNTYAANFEKALKALEERAQSAEKQLADLRGDVPKGHIMTDDGTLLKWINRHEFESGRVDYIVTHPSALSAQSAREST